MKIRLSPGTRVTLKAGRKIDLYVSNSLCVSCNSKHLSKIFPRVPLWILYWEMAKIEIPRTQPIFLKIFSKVSKNCLKRKVN